MCIVVALAAASTTSAATAPRVTVIGDSILTAVQWNTTPMAILGQGFDLQMEIGVCRRIAGQSCPYEGGEVPTLVDLVPQLGSSIAQTVIVEVGSNDPQDVFAQEVEDAMHVLLHYGVTRVLWMNFHEVQGQYPAMNQALVSAAQRYPQLSVVDWNAAAAGHPDWFQTDGIHLLYPGAEAMATLLHNALVSGVAPPPPPPDPPLVLHYTAASRPHGARLRSPTCCKGRDGSVPLAGDLGAAAEGLAVARGREDHRDPEAAGALQVHLPCNRCGWAVGDALRDPRDRARHRGLMWISRTRG